MDFMNALFSRARWPSVPRLGVEASTSPSSSRLWPAPKDSLDEDAFFFAFARRGRPDPADLEARTSLQRAILSVWRAGGHWHLVEGRLAAPRREEA